MYSENQERSRKGISGLVLVGCLLISLAICILTGEMADIADKMQTGFGRADLMQGACKPRDCDHDHNADQAAIHHDFKRIKIKAHGAPCNRHGRKRHNRADHPQAGPQSWRDDHLG